MDSITLQEVLKAFDAGEHFEIAFITADKQKKRAGEWITIKRAWKHVQPKRTGNPLPVSPSPFSTCGEGPGMRAPNHFENRTRNIMLPNGEIRKLHIRLIRRFNGKTVI